MTNRSTDGPSQTPGASVAASAEAGGADPLASLHKMSRTAGVGTQEYVAVNVTSVVALLLGLASVAALPFGPMLLVVPAAAVIVGIVAVRQVQNSAGTQTGRGIAVAGIVLALLFVLLVGGREFLHARKIASEQDAIVSLIDQFGKNISQGNYDAAWQQMGPRFREQATKEHFTSVWTTMQSDQRYGQIKSMRWNNILDVKIDKQTGTTIADGMIIIELASGQSDRRGAAFRKTPEQGWVIEGLQDFPMAPARPREGQQAPR